MTMPLTGILHKNVRAQETRAAVSGGTGGSLQGSWPKCTSSLYCEEHCVSASGNSGAGEKLLLFKGHSHFSYCYKHTQALEAKG